MTSSLEEHAAFREVKSQGADLFTLRKSLLLTTDFPPQVGGIGSLLFNLYRQMDMSQLTLIAPEHCDAKEFDACHPYTAVRIPIAWNIPVLRGAAQVWRMYRAAEELAAANPDLVLHCGHVNCAFAARRLKRRFGTPYLVWTYGLEVMDKWLRKRIIPALLEADLVLTISEYTCAFLVSLGVPEPRIVKILPGTDPARFQPNLDCEEVARRLGAGGRPILLTVARIVKANRYKGHDVVIRALPRILKSIPDLVYVIAGGGDDLGYLDSVSRKCGVRNKVIFAGCVPDAELPLLYNACDVFVMSSRQDRNCRGVLTEGFGLALLEASACGKPVIAGRSGGMPDAVQDEVSGLLVDSRDPNAISGAVVRLLHESGLADRLGKNGRRWVETEMNWGRAAAEFYRALARLSRNASRPSELFPDITGAR